MKSRTGRTLEIASVALWVAFAADTVWLESARPSVAVPELGYVHAESFRSIGSQVHPFFISWPDFALQVTLFFSGAAVTLMLLKQRWRDR